MTLKPFSTSFNQQQPRSTSIMSIFRILERKKIYMKHQCTWKFTTRIIFRTITFIIVFSWIFTQKMHSFYVSKAIIINKVITYNTMQLPQKKNNIDLNSSKLLIVKDVIIFLDEVLILIQAQKGVFLPRKEDYECVFAKSSKSPIASIGFKEPELIYVRCSYPSKNQIFNDTKRIATLGIVGSNMLLDSVVNYSCKFDWKNLIYETIIEHYSIILFVKGLHIRKSNMNKLHDFYCVFGNMDVVTRIQIIAKEVVRCTNPHPSFHESLKGKKISIQIPKFGLMSSVAYFGDPTFEKHVHNDKQIMFIKKHFLCACTMIWNQAQFLKEWIMYHSYLGIEHFYLYDNNSEDELEEVVSESLAQYNVTHHFWPWHNSQQAGFSHCALRAKFDCEWIMFIDVDEFLYPIKYLNSKSPSIIKNLITTEIKNIRGHKGGSYIGEVRLDCHDFGPSGLTHHPEEGVMIGYTCRTYISNDHKSILRVNALNASLFNVIHHFELQRPYRAINLHHRVAVINHYKYQVWNVSKPKFLKRMTTWITNWTRKENYSNHCLHELDTKATQPFDWPDCFCEVVDLGLRNFTLQIFQHPHTHQFLWQ